MKSILSILMVALVIVLAGFRAPADAQTIQSVTSNLRYTWDQPSAGITLAQANGLVVKSYLDSGPQGPSAANAVDQTFKCVAATDTSIFTCQLLHDVASLIGTNTGIHRIVVSVQTRNSDGSLTPEAYAPEWTFRFDVAVANAPKNPRFAVPLP